MACAALKRPHNFDILTGSPEQLTGSQKRRRCGVLLSNSPSSLPVSPFLEATPKVCRDELSRNVQDEWRRIQRRRRLGCPASPPQNLTNFQTSSLFNNLTSSSTNHWLSSMSTNSTGSSSPSRGMVSPGSMSPPRGKEQPTLTLKQVTILCERLWKEREENLRQEYDQVLNERLTEQYDSFLKFTQDQIMRKYQQSSCSYVS